MNENKLLAGRYLLREVIGEGGFSVVYSAIDNVRNKKVVVKTLKEEYSLDHKQIVLFKKEASIALKLRHKNIVKTFDSGRDGNIYYMVMDFIDGRSLKHIINLNNVLPVKFVVDISKKISLALEYAHSKGVVHCDIKPQNIMIDMQGEPYLMDFGISGHIDSSTPYFSKSGQVLGSVHYLSPEQAKAEKLDGRTDIYSLGIVMYEMLTGSVPFEGESSIEIALKHINEDVPDVEESTDQKVPESLQNIIIKATQKNIENRYKSALLMARDIDRCLEDKSGKYVNVSSDVKTKKEKAKKKAKKLKLFTILILCAAAVIAVLLFFGIFGYADSVSKEYITVPFVVNESEEDAKNSISAQGLICSIEYVFSDDIPEGVVISQSPQSGSSAKSADVVTVTVSNGPEFAIQMPDVTGLLLEEAETLLGIEKIVNFDIFEEVSSDIEAGYVIRQSPKADEIVYKDDVVILTVSSGTIGGEPDR